MDRNSADRYLKILEISQHDEKYLEYYYSYQSLQEDVRDLFARLSDMDGILIADYFGLREAMEMRLLQLACEHTELFE